MIKRRVFNDLASSNFKFWPYIAYVISCKIQKKFNLEFGFDYTILKKSV